MFLEYFRAENIAAFDVGVNRSVIEIDFNKFQKNRTVLILGGNMKGKSSLITLFSAILEGTGSLPTSRLPIEGKDATIILIFRNHQGKRYRCQHFINKRGNVKSYISQINEDKTEEELNVNGNVTSYKELVFLHLDYTVQFDRVGMISKEAHSIVNMTATARKNFISIFLPAAAELIRRFNIMNRYLNILKKEISNITLEIDKIGKEDDLYLFEKKLEKEIRLITTEREKLLKMVARAESFVENITMGKDLEGIFYKYRAIHNNKVEKLKKINDRYNKILKIKDGESTDATSYIEELKKDIGIKEPQLKIYESTLSTMRQDLTSLKTSKASKESSLNKDYKVDVDIKKYQDTKEKLTTELTNVNENIKTILKSYPNASQVKALTSKDCERFLNFVFSLNGLIDNLISAYSHTNIVSLFCHNDLSELIVDTALNLIDNDLKSANKLKESINNQLQQKLGKVELKEALDQRPSSCKIDSCPFIKDALQYINVIDEIDVLKKEIIDVTIIIRTNTKAREDLLVTQESYIRFMSDISGIRDYIAQHVSVVALFTESIEIGNMQGILRSVSKLLPQVRKYVELRAFLDRFGELTTKIENVDSILDKCQLNDSYATKIKLDVAMMMKDINEKNDVYESTLKEYRVIKDTVDSSTGRINDLQDVSKLQEEIISSLKDYNFSYPSLTNMKKRVAQKKTVEYMISDNKKLLRDRDGSNIEKTKEIDNIRYKIRRLADLKNRIKDLDHEYYLAETCCEVWSPKTGITLDYMKDYLQDVKIDCNKYLYYMWKDELYIEDFDLNDKEFRINIRICNKVSEDVKTGSDAARASVAVVIALSLIFQTTKNSNYNIIRLDEIDGALEPDRRSYFVDALNHQLDEINCEQAFLITHNNEFKQDVDFILFPGARKHINNKHLINTNVILDLE